MIEYVKVKHDEECYICHSRENVKTLRVAADSSNAANTLLSAINAQEQSAEC